MNNSSAQNQGKPATSTFQITIKGALDEQWADWFNGMLVSFERNSEDRSHTIITCQVRDQSELLGILNWLHSLNLTLLQLDFIQEVNNGYRA